MLRKLEKYEVLEEIGHGGMATVYRAHDTVLEREVALKVMHPHLRGAEEARRRFQREARSVARLRHPRVLEIYDFSGEGSSEAFIAAELLTGPTLKKWREDHQDVPAEIAACFAIEIARALEAAHAAGIVHRDVKPENVLLHEDRTIKLTDFGIADMVDSASMTATGQILGSPGHMAPEQIEGKDTDKRTDLFSLGTVLYYLATGRLPFTGRNPHQILKRIVDGEYADPLRVNPTIGGRLRAIIQKALERDPDHRYQTADELREALEAFVAEAGIDDPSDTLERYLKGPEAVGAEIIRGAIDRLIDHGARASDAGDVPAALDYYNRVLALDEGNERVLKLIERVGMDRRRRQLMMTGLGMIAFGLVAGGTAWAVWPDGRNTDPPIAPIGPIAASTVDAGTAMPDAGPPLTEDAGSEAVAITAPDAGPTRPADAGRARTPANGDRTNGQATRPRAPRPIRIVTTTARMQIAVDGGDARPLDTVRRDGLELSPGRHAFRLVPESGIATCYRETTRQIVVEPGREPQTVTLNLDMSPARLFVDSNVPGQVTVRVGGPDGQIRGRGATGSFIEVATQQCENETLRVYVSSPGYQTAAQRARFTAGGDETTHVRVELERAAAPPEDEAAPTP